MKYNYRDEQDLDDDIKPVVYNDIDENDIEDFEDFENLYSINDYTNDEGEPEELNF